MQRFELFAGYNEPQNTHLNAICCSDFSINDTFVRIDHGEELLGLGAISKHQKKGIVRCKSLQDLGICWKLGGKECKAQLRGMAAR